MLNYNIFNLFSNLFFKIYSYFIYLVSNNYLNDAAEPWQIGFQDSASPGMTGIVELHNDIFYFLVLILFSVFWVLGVIVYVFKNSNSPIVYKYWTHGTLIELIWTITPIY